MRIANFAAALIGVALLISTARGDTLTLKDGSTVEGKVIAQGNRYWVKLADNSTRYIDKDDVTTWTHAEAGKGTASASAVSRGGSASASATASGSGSSAIAVVSPAGTANFALTKSRADTVETPVLAVQIWQKFLDANPAATDAAAAKTELEKWQGLQNENAEKIGGKWIGGSERKELLKKVKGLVKEGFTAIRGDQTLEGTKKLEEALKIYPNSFEANFGLGYIYLLKGAVGATGRGNVGFQDKAIKSLETASKIRPTSAAAWSNLAIAYNYRSRYQESVESAYKAVKLEDSKETVQNLVNSIAFAPKGMQTSNDKIRPMVEDAFVLASKRGVAREGAQWTYLPPTEPTEHAITPTELAGEGKPGPAWRGSGFFITSDGYLITNHHVATGSPKSPVLKNISFLIRLDDGKQKNADLIAVDDKADIALLKIKSDSPLPFLKIANDNPKQAAQALVLGYPVTGLDEPSLQVAGGDVASINIGDDHEVWFHLETTHGNSGGPIVDKSGRLIAILSGGRSVYNVTYVLGVGPNQIKNFLKAVGERAPKVEYAQSADGEFNGEKLAEQARKATVLITAIRGGEQTNSSAVAAVESAATSKPAAP